MVGPFHPQGAAESDASVRLRVRSHVPGTRRDRAQADEAGIRKAEPRIGLLPQSLPPRRRGNPPMGRLQKGSAHEPPPENVGSGRDIVGMLDRRQVRA
jgi:hypothetical protein